jgi:hypothetical protein
MTTRSQKRARLRVNHDQDATAALPVIEAPDPAARAPMSLLRRLILLREAARMRSILTHNRADRLPR